MSLKESLPPSSITKSARKGRTSMGTGRLSMSAKKQSRPQSIKKSAQKPKPSFARVAVEAPLPPPPVITAAVEEVVEEPEPVVAATVRAGPVRVVAQLPSPAPIKKKIIKSKPAADVAPPPAPVVSRTEMPAASEKAAAAQKACAQRLKERAMKMRKSKKQEESKPKSPRGRSRTIRTPVVPAAPASAAAAAASIEEKPAAAPSARTINPNSRLLAITKAANHNRTVKRAASAAPAPVASVAAHKPRDITVPVSPKLSARRSASSAAVITTEEAEFQQATKMKMDLKEKLRQRNVYKEKAANGIMGISRAKAAELSAKRVELTQPLSPELPTSVRYGAKQYGIQGNHTDMAMLNPNSIAVAANSETHGLRSRDGSPDSVSSSTPRKPTVPTPFSFGTSSARKSAYVATDPKTPPLADRQREHYKSLNAPSSCTSAMARSFRGGNGGELKLTQAQSPKFVSRAARAKPKSTQELEEEIMNRLKTNPFKALPVNFKIMKSTGAIGVPKVSASKTTKAKSFKLRCDERGAKDANSSFNSVNTSLDRSVDKSQTSFSSATKRELTTPRSPNFSTNKRLGKKQVAKEEDMATPKRNMSFSAYKGSAQKSVTKTIITPFKLHTEDRGSATKMKMEKIKRDEEEEQHRLANSFKANDVPNYNSFGYSGSAKKALEVRPLTEPMAPSFQTDVRGEFAREQLKAKIEFEQNQILSNSAVKAKPVPETTYRPNFTPKRVERAPLVGVSPDLVTKSQSKNRAEFDRVNKERIESIQKEQDALKNRREQEEQEELKELRSMPVSEGGYLVEANPIVTEDQFPCTGPVVEKMLTEPVFSPSSLATSSLRSMR
jgi:hypothetical protein